MMINLSEEMLNTLRSACCGRLVLLRRLLRGSKGNMRATSLLLAKIEDAQAALNMLNEGGE